MKLGTHMPDGERRKPIDMEVCRSKVKVTLSKHMFATRLSHLKCVTDFFFFFLSLRFTFCIKFRNKYIDSLKGIKYIISVLISLEKKRIIMIFDKN